MEENKESTKKENSEEKKEEIKEEPKHEHKAEHHYKHVTHAHKHKKPYLKNITTWQAATAVLGVILLISLFTGGFSSYKEGECTIDNMITEVDKLSSSSESEELTVALGNTKESLLNAQSLIAASEPKGQDPVEKPSTAPSTKTSGDAVKLDFYVMSQCPYGTQVEDAIYPVLQKLGDNVDFNLHFISTDLGDGTFRSLHGDPETNGNIVQLCAAKYNPDKYMDMIICQNKNTRAIPGNWETCAQDGGLDVASIKTCYEGDEGKSLLSASAKETAKVGATGSPTIYLNDASYSSGRTEADLLRAICNEFETMPETCGDIPEPKKVTVTILNDKRCADCDTSSLIGSLKGLFPGLKSTTIDYTSEEGKKLYDDLQLQNLPALLFDDSVKEGEGYSRVQGYLTPTGDYLSLAIGASFDPTTEICDNEKDDTGDGLVDCDDPGCKDAMECREEVKNNLQVFIMSDCPYGKKAVEALNGVIDNFGDKVDYEIHYIANEQGDGFSSLHGQYEVDEDIIQLCANKHSPDQWFDYMYCRSTKGVKGIDWKDCATETGVDIDTVQTCFNGDEGKGLLREDIKVASSLGIGASPTWLANNQYTFGGIDAESVKSNLCKYNPDIEGCGNTLESDTGGVPAGSC